MKKITSLCIFLLFSLIVASTFSSCKCQKSKTKKKQETTEIKAILKTDKTFIPSQEKLDFGIDTAYISGNELIIKTTIKGGCGEHSFELVWAGDFLKSLPMKAPLHLVHNAVNENCKDLKKYLLRFDVTDLKQPKNKLVILLGNYNKSGLILEP